MRVIRPPLWFAWCCCVLLFAGREVAAAPAFLKWETLETAHFRVHFHEGAHQYEMAQKVARICEQAHALLVPLVGWEPSRRTEVLFTDDIDTANGSAVVTLRPVMRLYADAPDSRSVLNDYEDYLWALIVHEYTHILHLDRVEGIPSVINHIFGKVFVPNGFTPRWLTEGYATYEESNLSAGGRIRSSLFDMWLRASVVDGRPFRLDEASHIPTAWPGGSLAYLYGGRFLRYVAERVGPEKLGPYFGHYGSRPIPFAINRSAKNVFAIDWVTLYDDWIASLTAHYQAQLKPVRDAGITPLRPLTRSGENTDLPRFSRDGSRVFYSEGGRDRRYGIRSVALDGSDDRLEVPLWQPVVFDLSRDNRWLVFAASEVYRENYVAEELFLVDREKQSRPQRLTFGLRGTDPAFHPDGTRIAFIGRSGAGSTYLGEYDLHSRQVRVLFTPPLGERLFTPAYGHDGETLVFTQQVGRFQQLRRFHFDDARVDKLGPTTAMVVEPTVGSDGKVYLSSDRSGIYNVYRLDPATGVSEQLTNLETGAFRPQTSADGKLLAVATYSSRGFDIATVALDQRFAGESPAAVSRPEPFFRDDPLDVYPVHDYRSRDTLWPQYWSPLIVSDPLGTVIGASTDGSDIVGKHAYRLQGSYGLASQEPGFSAAYTNNALSPSVGLGVSSGIAQAAGFEQGTYDRRWTATLASSMTFTRRSNELSTVITGGYEFRTFDPRVSLAYQPDGPLPLLPRAGTSGALSISVGLSTARSTTNAISAERGGSFSLTVRRSGPETFGSFEFATAEARGTAFLTMPWRRHHVLAFRGALGVGKGDLGSRQLFALGGLTVEEPLLQLLEGRSSGGDVLRGYPPGFLGGNSFGLGSLEYRFPVSDLNRGLFSLPFFFRRVHAAVFTDAGTVGDDALALQRPRVSVGLELRLELLLRYDYGSLLRLGYAQGLSEGGGPTAYVTVGSTF